MPLSVVENTKVRNLLLPLSKYWRLKIIIIPVKWLDRKTYIDPAQSLAMAAITKEPEISGLPEHNFLIILGARRLSSKSTLISSGLSWAYRWVSTWSSPSTCLCANFLFIKSLNILDKGPPWWFRFNLFTPWKTLHPNTITVCSIKGWDSNLKFCHQ